MVNVLNPDKDIVQNALDETLNLDNVSCQSPNEELDLDNQDWDTLMNTMPKYSFCVGSQKILIDTNFFVQLRKKIYFPHVINSDDVRAKVTLTRVIYLNPQEALKSTLSDMTILILLPNDQNLANFLLKHVKTQVQRSKNKSAALVLLSSTENNEYLLPDFHYVGEEPLNLKYKDSPQIVRLWRLGKFLKYRPRECEPNS